MSRLWRKAFSIVPVALVTLICSGCIIPIPLTRTDRTTVWESFDQSGNQIASITQKWKRGYFPAPLTPEGPAKMWRGEGHSTYSLWDRRIGSRFELSFLRVDGDLKGDWRAFKAVENSPCWSAFQSDYEHQTDTTLRITVAVFDSKSLRHKRELSYYFAPHSPDSSQFWENGFKHSTDGKSIIYQSIGGKRIYRVLEDSDEEFHEDAIHSK